MTQQQTSDQAARQGATEEQAASVDRLVDQNKQMSTADFAAAGGEPQQAENRQPTGADSAEAERTPVMSEEAAEEYRGRWQETQADFVDDPRSAVAAADSLVAEVMKRIAEDFANERNGLEKQWNEGGEASTEDLRLAFQRYRSFFSRLLSI
jgi:hypothetical protein